MEILEREEGQEGDKEIKAEETEGIRLKQDNTYVTSVEAPTAVDESEKSTINPSNSLVESTKSTEGSPEPSEKRSEKSADTSVVSTKTATSTETASESTNTKCTEDS